MGRSGLWRGLPGPATGRLGNDAQTVEDGRDGDDDGQGGEGRHEDRSLRDALPRLGPSGRDVDVLRGWQGSHDGHRHEGRTRQSEQYSDAARDCGHG